MVGVLELAGDVGALVVAVEEVFGELGELAGAEEGLGVDQAGRQDFGVAVLAGVEVEHEVGEGALEAGARSRSWRTKRAPEILAARSKSRMPRASPISQWGLAGKSKVGMSPQVFWTTLSCSEVPAGTSSWGRLGRDSRSSRSLRSAAVARGFELLGLFFERRWFARATEGRRRAPSRLRRPNSAERALRWALRVSASVMAGAALGVEGGEALEECGVYAAQTEFFFDQREIRPHKG